MNGIYGPPTCGIPGYPYAPEDWSEVEVEAIKTAHDEDVELGADHLELLCALQEYFSKHSRQGINTRELHDALDEKFHIKGGIKYLYALLPKGPVTQGCRLAGLPVPTGAVDRSCGSVQ